MSEAKKEGEDKKKEVAAKGKKPAGPTPAEILAAEKKKKATWTLEKCLKAARRFSSETAWAEGAPASYKSAHSHGWIKQCISGMAGVKQSIRKSA